jgi:DHA1 family tetracycline resistance protein-like MFS transporter
LIIFLIIFVNLLGFGIIIPLLPFYARTFGASPLIIGLLFASYSVCQLLAAPVLGELSDRHGRRPVLLFSLLGTALSFVLLAVAHNLLLLFVARIIDGLSGGNISTARAYIADVTTEENRARGFGLIGAAFGLGFIFGPALGGFLGRFGYGTPAWAAAGLAFAAMVLTWIWLPETARRTPARREMPWRDLPRVLTRPVLGQLLVLDFLYWAASALYQTTFALFGARRFGFDVAATGYMLAFFGAIGVIVQLGLVGPAVQRIGERRTLAIGLALTGLGLGWATVIYRVDLLVAALIPAAVGNALTGPALISLLSRAVGPEEQGRVQGASGAVESLGRVIGPVWGNGTLGAFGEGAAFGSAALILLIIAGWTTRLPALPRQAVKAAHVVGWPRSSRDSKR